MRDPIPARRESGFTIVEVMVAVFVLLVGMLGVLTMLTGAMGTTATNAERIAATNVARQLVEGARGMDYDNLTTALLPTQLQATGLGSGAPWIIERRGVSYTITATSCTFDDPVDGRAASAPAGACAALAATGPDPNGDDFRRVTFRVSWSRSGTVRSVTQTALIVNPSGGLGPRIISSDPATQTITSTSTSTASVVWTTTLAKSLHWSMDDGVSAGDVSGTTSFTTTWNIGNFGSADEVLDGTYQMTAQPFDDRDIPGEAKRASIVLNRRVPFAPPSIAGGHDTRVNDWVDLEWDLNSERDVLGYRAYWTGPDGAVAGGDDQMVCPATAGAMLAPTTTTCADTDPPPGATKYYVVAVDRAPDPDPGLREGSRRVLSVSAPSSRPDAPSGTLTVSTVGDLPHLSWSAPASGGVSFYRIYRDGTEVGYADRYDRTGGATTTFVDGHPGTTSHRYWVTTVDSSYNESDPIGPVTWTP